MAELPCPLTMEEATARMLSLYGENKRIEDGSYDESCAVKCVNGTFVGKKNDGVLAFKGIPFVGKQPTGDLRWKAPVDVEPDDGVYEAYYFGKIPHKAASVGQMGSLYPQGEDCLWLNVWKADDGACEKKTVMVWIGAIFGGRGDLNLAKEEVAMIANSETVGAKRTWLVGSGRPCAAGGARLTKNRTVFLACRV